jgi:hypothetical protein
MKDSILKELRQHLIEAITDQYNDDDANFDELHFEAFNQDYYIIGYYEANEWLKSHEVDAFEAIEYVMEQEKQHFGESSLKADDFNSERIVNLLVYFAGFDVMPNCDLSNISKNELLELLNSEG